MYTVRIFYMMVPLPKIWKKKFENLNEAKIEVKKRYEDHTALGYSIKTDDGKIIEREGVIG